MDNLNREIHDFSLRVIKERNLPFLLDSKYCIQYRKTHEKCSNCESYRGCNVVCNIKLIFLKVKLNKEYSNNQALNDLELIREGREMEVFHEKK